tara:strand:+ start:7078 stop:7656 length:579 start_codon:yes stop_codon:yes gene_type:complete
MPSTALHEKTIEESFLLTKVGVGDSQAFEELYTRYSTPLYSLGLRMLNNPSEAEETLQDTFVKIWNNAASYDARKSRPFTWSVTIMRRTCIDRIRKLSRELDVINFEAEQDRDWVLPETVRESAENHETRENVEKMMKDFSPNQKKALELALFSGMTHSEIAKSMEQPLGTVKSWLKRGLFQLRTTVTKPAI